MAVITHKGENHTGRECWVFDGEMWQRATVTGPERVIRAPFFGMSGYSELPITPVRLGDGQEIEAGCLTLAWNEPEWTGIRKELRA